MADKNKLPQKQYLNFETFTELHSLPRLFVSSNRTHIYVQIIDDDKRVTLMEAKTEIKHFLSPAAVVAAARMVGHAVAKSALAAGITEVVFERRTPFSGFVQTLASTVRQAGLKF